MQDRLFRLWLALPKAGVLLAWLCLTGPVWAGEGEQIIIGAHAAPLEHYAAKELQRYLCQLSGTWLEIVTNTLDIRSCAFVVGQRHTNPLIKRLVADGHLSVASNDPGPEGYVLKKVVQNGLPLILIAGSDEAGCLYGVYGLLSDYYHIGFFPMGTVLPERKTPLVWVDVNEKREPTMAVRGLLPWSNFPQSVSSFSWEDWTFLLDQMARMRFNLLHLHTYAGERDYNEMFAGFALHGYTARARLATARTGHPWHGPGWEPSHYLFQSGDLFDDYDFGADCALHNESLSNEQVLQKGVTLFQKIIAYAHTRSIKVALGLDVDRVPAGYGAAADNPEVIAARAQQVAGDYPDLDYLVCFQSEEADKDRKFHERWRTTFLGFYRAMKARAPSTRLAVSGWSLAPQSVAELPADVICAPIAKYSDQFESGAVYGRRMYWGCPWLERDWLSSQYYYPYNIHLSKTIAAYRNRADNMKGFCALTWRLSDAVEPKLWYVSQVPWSAPGRSSSAEQVYHDYAVLNYGPEVANDIARIINENEPYAGDFAECQGTAEFAPQSTQDSFLFRKRPAAESSKCLKQLATIEDCISRTDFPGRRARLKLLQARLAAVKAHLELNDNFQRYKWPDLPGAMEPWVRQFNERVTDTTFLGNLVSVQNRFVQLRYLVKERALRANQLVRAPGAVVARGTRDGAVISWKNEEPHCAGFHVYRNGMRLTVEPLPAGTTRYTDRTGGVFRYGLSALNAAGYESPASVSSVCQAGSADRDPPQIVVISPPTSLPAGQDASIKARVLDGRSYDQISATLFYRTPCAGEWKELPMPRRTKAVFAVRLPASGITASGLEYYIECSDGDNTARFPASAPEMPLSLVRCAGPDLAPPDKPGPIQVVDRTLRWSRSGDDVFLYRIYRSDNPCFEAGPATFLTYVPREVTSFRDEADDFDGSKKHGNRFYRITAENKAGLESMSTDTALLTYP